MNGTHDQLIKTTSALLAEQGLAATGLAQIIGTSGTPKGSIYYYFPDGKDGLAEAAIRWSGQRAAERIRAMLVITDTPGRAVQQVVLDIAQHLELSEFRTGGPILTVAMETATTNPRLNQACQDAYHRIETAFADGLHAAGIDYAEARRLASTINLMIEGGVVLSRTFHRIDPLQQAAEQLVFLIDHAGPAAIRD